MVKGMRAGARLGVGLLVVGLLGLAGAGQAQPPAAASAASSASAPEHGDESALIHQVHMQRLADRVLLTPEEIKAQCRFESDITTPPPAGKIALTFDDGPEPGATQTILEVLQRHHAPAAFFMIGEKVERHPELVAQVQAQGHHVIASHSWSHPNFHAIAPEVQESELNRGEESLRKVPGPLFFRYPYGNSTCTGNELLRSQGYKIVGWHIDSCDWAFDRHGQVDAKEALECGVLPQNRKDYVAHVLASARAHNGGIILMHEIHPHTVQQLDNLLSELEKAGFSYGSITDPDFQGALR